MVDIFFTYSKEIFEKLSQFYYTSLCFTLLTLTLTQNKRKIEEVYKLGELKKNYCDIPSLSWFRNRYNVRMQIPTISRVCHSQCILIYRILPDDLMRLCASNGITDPWNNWYLYARIIYIYIYIYICVSESEQGLW